jgi:tetratricopeptide (TPR) repeat protein
VPSPSSAPALFSIDALLPAAVVRQLERDLESHASQRSHSDNNSSGSGPSIPLIDDDARPTSNRRLGITHRHGARLAELGRAHSTVAAALEGCIPDTRAREAERRVALSVAAAHKERGNAYFSRRAWTDAARHYSLALRLSFGDSKLAAVCLSNRAAALQHIGLLEHATADCEASVRLDAAYDNAWARLAALQLRRGCPSQCIEAAARVTKPKPDLLQRRNEAQQLVASKGTSASRAPLLHEPPPASVVLPSSHSTLVGASSSILVQRSERAGRFVVARAPIERGEAIVQERAYAAVLRNAFRPRPIDITTAAAGGDKADAATLPSVPANVQRWRCESCFKPLLVLSPATDKSSNAAALPVLWFVRCPRCPAALYCSPSCLEADAAEGHERECGAHPLMQRLPEVTKLALRMATKHAMAEATEASAKDKAAADAVHSLLTHLDDIPASALVEYECQAALAASLMAHQHAHGCGCTVACASPASSSYSPSSSPLCWHERVTFDRVLHHLCQTRTNIYAVTEVTSISSSESAGPADSLQTSVQQQRLAIAVFPTAALLNHSCAPNIALSYRGRNLLVRAAQPIPAGAEVLNCYGPCRGHHSLAQRQQALRDEYHFACDCTFCREEQKQGPRRAEQQRQRLLAAAAEQDACALEFVQMGRCAEAARRLEQSLVPLAALFGADSIELAHQRAQLAQLQLRAGAARAARESARAAASVLDLYCAPDHDALLQVRALLASVGTAT